MQPFYENHAPLFHCFYFNMDSFPSHLHKEIEIAWVESGRMNVRADGEEFILESGDAMVLLPNVIHSYQMEEESRILMTVFDPSLAAHSFGNLMACGCKEPYVRKERVHPDVPECLGKLLGLEGKGAPGFLVTSYHVLVLGHILGELELMERKDESADNHIQRILSFTSQHYREFLSIGDVADAVGLSRYYVSKIFNQKINCSFTAYLNALRLNFAADRLLSTDETVENIAVSSGFDSSRSFYRNFQRVYHVTPGEYRRAYHRKLKEEM